MKKLHPITFAKFQALLCGILGVVIGIIYAFGGLAIDAGVTLGLITSNDTPGLSIGTLLAFGALIGMPIIFYMIGLVFGFIEAVLFNLLEPWVGRYIKVNQLWKTKN